MPFPFRNFKNYGATSEERVFLLQDQFDSHEIFDKNRTKSRQNGG